MQEYNSKATAQMGCVFKHKKQTLNKRTEPHQPISERPSNSTLIMQTATQYPGKEIYLQVVLFYVFPHSLHNI